MVVKALFVICGILFVLALATIVIPGTLAGEVSPLLQGAGVTPLGNAAVYVIGALIGFCVALAVMKRAMRG
jgi:hypothetical protein